MSTTHFGLYGLGTMGSALSLNIAEKGYGLHVASFVAEDTDKFLARADCLGDAFTGHRSLADMVKSMPSPRAIILLVPAGQAVDDSITEAQPYLQPGDVIIDAGNANFHDTRRRATMLEKQGLAYLGMGVSGGEHGARTGPAMMVGGTEAVWNGVRPMLEAIAADFQGEPCVDRVGPDGAGHFVKTVHNGIEYADMQLIAEAYGLMRHGAGWSTTQIADLFDDWNKGVLKSYLMEISATVLRTHDPDSGQPFVDLIVDSAGQKGTGRWTAIEALTQGVSVSTIEAAVGARVWSADRNGRATGAALFAQPRAKVDLDPAVLHQAVLATRIVCHSQGFDLLQAASCEFDWAMDLARCAEIWRAGCIIRSDLLDEIATALRGRDRDDTLAFCPEFADELALCLPALRQIVTTAIAAAQPVPVMMAALGWLDAMSQARGTADLIQGQRDFFGRHGVARVDKPGVFHGPWSDGT
ncbi:NADP-dependent phosphogluconate dehydrogenase [Ruegeria profundi]|uniref:6-phosphogluconate dehydrogenase, decarboxylating n=1 Tax=Ruegeria profundi TaxID=1685378 RepID=A0A0X3TZW0_9RHOB|nr:NADP-dependent phosphogluconate dehydrogenase [Ruegeria profundi]KUJ81172.1 phosphogluconate dehydrogenase (NADP(+)-dependent, decarboxylating) [Ruegeria profundi]